MPVSPQVLRLTTTGGAALGLVGKRPHAERVMTGHHALGLAAAAAFMLMQPANAIDTMESIGAEKCSRAAKAYEIEFLAPYKCDGRSQSEGPGQRHHGRASKCDIPFARWQGVQE
jgi:hypothetical protein